MKENRGENNVTKKKKKKKLFCMSASPRTTELTATKKFTLRNF